MAPALAAGNCVVLKPAEQTPLNALRFAQIAEEAGVPAGTINVLPGESRAWEPRMLGIWCGWRGPMPVVWGKRYVYVRQAGFPA